MNEIHGTASFFSDAELGYERGRASFSAGHGLIMDEAYRLAHLPLVAPSHPRVIPRQPNRDYEMGIHAHRIFSIVMPVQGVALDQSFAFKQLEDEVHRAAFGDKINWARVHERRDKLHATVCGSMSVDTPPLLTNRQRSQLASVGPITCEVRGLFSGNLNIGRLYLRLYPERRPEGNPIRAIQRILGMKETDVYLVGVYSLTDDLSPGEAADLNDLISRWWTVPLLQIKSFELVLQGTMDDLALDSIIVDRVPHSYA